MDKIYLPDPVNDETLTMTGYEWWRYHDEIERRVRDHLLTLLIDMRTYAQHAPYCAYEPSYPDKPVATCDCYFDAVLQRYDLLMETK